MRKCFVISPLGDEGSPARLRSDDVLEFIITPALEQSGYKVPPLRADHLPDPGRITRQIIDHLLKADLVIADLTDHNPNVFYELAIRHASRKPVVQIIHVKDRIPFDVADQRTIFYNHENLRAAHRATQELVRQIQAAEVNPGEVDTPLTEAVLESLPASIGRRSILFRRESEEVGFRSLAQNASTIDIVGWSCSWFFDAHDGFLQEKLSSGCRIRVLLVASDGAAAKVIMDNSRNKALISDIEKAKIKASRLIEVCAGKAGTFEMKEVDWVTPWGAVLIDTAKHDGVASIGFHPIFLPTPLDSRRFAIVDAATAPSDLEYFRGQFEGLWDSERAKVVCATAQRVPPKETGHQADS